MQKILLPSVLRRVFIPVWAVTAVACAMTFPWFFWTTLLVLPAVTLLLTEARYLRTRQGKQILGICFSLLGIHVIWALIRSTHYSAAVPDTYWFDDYYYYQQASAIAEAWTHGLFPDIWKKGSPPYLGTLHVGYHRPLSALFFVTKPSTLAGLLLNSVCCSILPLLAALASRYLWVDNLDAEPRLALPAKKDSVLISALLVAVHPNQFYWASYLLKDVFVAMMFMISLVLILGSWRRKNVPMGTAAILVLAYFFSVRIYAAFSLIIGMALLPALHLKKAVTAQFMLAGIICLTLLFAYTSTGYRLYQQMTASLFALAPGGNVNIHDLLIQMAAGIPALFLAPYSWLHFNKPSPMYGLYPGMWFMYLVGYPLGFAGLYATMRRNITLAIIPITAFGVASLIFLISTHGGNASRQRFYLEYGMLLFAGYGFAHPSKGWIAGILIAELAFAVGQVLSLQ